MASTLPPAGPSNPARFLVAANVVGAALGFGQGLVVASVLSPAAFGVIGVLLAINAMVANLLDLRVTDLAARLFYRGPEDGQVTPGYRQSVVQLCLLGNFVLAAGMVVVGTGAGLVLGELFVDRSLAATWILVAALVLPLEFVSNGMATLVRLSGAFYRIAVWRLVIQAAALALFLIVLLGKRDLDGYFLALVLSTTASFVAGVVVAVAIWRRRAGIDLLRRADLRLALPDYRAHVRFLALTNVFGYSKMFHRAGDVLVMASVASDAVTGVYRLARLVTDALYVVYEALNQYYFPTLLEMLSQGRAALFRAVARKLAVLSALGVATAVALGAVALEPMADAFLSESFSGVEGPVLILLVPFFFVSGVHLWLWPLLVHRGEIGRFSVTSLVASIVQPLIVVGLSTAFGGSALYGALGYLSYYLVLYPISYFHARRLEPVACPAILAVADR